MNNATVNFSDLSNVKLKDATPPPLIPEGWYQGQITGLMKQRNAKSGNLGLEFPFILAAALDDVDAEALEAAGGLPKKTFSYTWWMSEEARFRFADFGRSLGKSDDLGIVELAEEIGSEMPVFKVQVKHEQRQDKNGQALFNPDGTPSMRTVFDNATGEGS